MRRWRAPLPARIARRQVGQKVILAFFLLIMALVNLWLIRLLLQDHGWWR